MDGYQIGAHRKFGRDQGMRKILPQAYGGYSDDKIFRITQISNQISGKLAIYGWALSNRRENSQLITGKAHAFPHYNRSGVYP
jgi:hypothetical protein